MNFHEVYEYLRNIFFCHIDFAFKIFFLLGPQLSSATKSAVFLMKMS